MPVPSCHLHSAYLAYIDAGSGSIAIQLLLAGVLGFGFTVRQKIANLWVKVRRKSASSSHDGPGSVA
ncbi:MAG: hypothetical protein ACHQ50_09855 [Fimbriimonadales bacterium]